MGEISSSPLPAYSSSSSSSSSSSLAYRDELEAALSSPQYQCNLLIPQLLEYKLSTDGICNFCNLSIHHSSSNCRLHCWHLSHQLPSAVKAPVVSSSTKLLKSVINDLPIWRKPYKTCTPFFKALEQLFSVHDVTDELLFKRYLFLSLSELSDADKTYAFDHIINTNQSWDAVKVSFSKAIRSI